MDEVWIDIDVQELSSIVRPDSHADRMVNPRYKCMAWDTKKPRWWKNTECWIRQGSFSNCIVCSDCLNHLPSRDDDDLFQMACHHKGILLLRICVLLHRVFPSVWHLNQCLIVDSDTRDGHKFLAPLLSFRSRPILRNDLVHRQYVDTKCLFWRAYWQLGHPSKLLQHHRLSHEYLGRSHVNHQMGYDLRWCGSSKDGKRATS